MRNELPYPGLRPFQESESKLFFGRDDQIEEIIQLLERCHFAAVMGGSGSGKSSIVRAGVIPKLRAYGISEQGDFWIPVTFTPGESPITRLAGELDQILSPEPTQEAGHGRLEQIGRILESPDGLQVFLSKYHDRLQVGPKLEGLRPHANLLVVVDQFEEIFRQGETKSVQSRYLVDLLVGAFKRRNSKVYVILTLRSEDLHRCAAYLSLPEVLNETVFLTRRLNEDELEQAIEYPPRVLSRQKSRQKESKQPQPIAFEGKLLRALYDELANSQADNDQLPLLQHLLYRLWENASGNEANQLPRQIGMTNLNGVILDTSKRNNEAENYPKNSLLALCLKTQANRIYESLGNDEHQQEVARVMFQLLAYLDNAGNYTRRWSTREQIREFAAKTTGIGAYSREKQQRIIDQVVQAFSKPHPYIREDSDQDHKLDVSHEAFIRKWPRFRKWLQEERAAIGVYLQIDEQYLDTEQACAGKPGLIRCFRQAYHGYLSRHMLLKVKRRQLLERGESWVRSYQGQRGTVLPDRSAQRYHRVAAYIRSSRIFSNSMIIMISMILLVLLSVVYISIEQQWELNASKKSERALNLEAQVFQPFGVGARMEQPKENFATARNDHYMAALWEGAVALKALMHNSGNQQLQDDNQRLRFERALRLSMGTVNEAISSLLGLPVWDLGATTDSSHYQPIPKSHLPANAGDLPCRTALGLEKTEKPYHVSLSGNPARPARGIYFDADRQLQFTFYSNSGGCKRVSQMGEAPDSELVQIDEMLRYYVVKSANRNPRTKKSMPYRFTFRGIKWLPTCHAAEASDTCEKSWEANSNGKSILLGKDLVYGPKQNLILLRNGESPRKLALTPALYSNTREVLPDDTSGCLETLNALGYPTRGAKQPIACGKNDSLLVFATWAEAAMPPGDIAESMKNHSQGKQIIDVLLLNGRLQIDKQHNKDVIKLPIARLSFSGEKITHLSFNDDGPSKISGAFNLQVESGYRQKMIWGGNALLQVACAILDKLPFERRNNIADSPFHSPFFKETAKSENSIINRHNNYECICGGDEQACTKSPQRQG